MGESEPQIVFKNYKRRDSLELGNLITSRIIEKSTILSAPQGLETIKENKDANIINNTEDKTLKAFEPSKIDKTQNLNKHYEQNLEEDSDPFYELFSCNRITFLGKLIYSNLRNIITVTFTRKIFLRI